jgi:hypothetical protein
MELSGCPEQAEVQALSTIIMFAVPFTMSLTCSLVFLRNQKKRSVDSVTLNDTGEKMTFSNPLTDETSERQLQLVVFATRKSHESP